MPPLPRQRSSAPRSVPRGPAKSGGEAPAGASSTSSESPPRAAPRGRSAAQREVLREELSRTYMVVGTVLRPFGRFVPVMAPIGDNLKAFSDEAADAWMELADKDPRVMDAIKSMMSASTWGNVIGIHIAIFSAAIPGGAVMGIQDQPQQQHSGMSPEEETMARELVAQMMGTPAGTPARDMGTGGPGDTVAAQPAPQFVAPPVNASPPSAAPPMIQSNRPRAAIVSPQELFADKGGVVNPGQQGAYSFPADVAPANGGAGGVT